MVMSQTMPLAKVKAHLSEGGRCGFIPNPGPQPRQPYSVGERLHMQLTYRVRNPIQSAGRS
jgi:hypothetical protein